MWVHPQSNNLPRLLTFLPHFMAWKMQPAALWILGNLALLGRKCLTIAACCVIGQVAASLCKKPHSLIKHPGVLLIPVFGFQKAPAAKASWVHEKSARSGFTIWWCDLTLSEAWWNFCRLGWKDAVWRHAGTWAWNELFLQIWTSCSDTPAGQAAIIIWERNTAQTFACFSCRIHTLYQLILWNFIISNAYDSS